MQPPWRRRGRAALALAIVLAAAALAVPHRQALALITGGTGNEPIRDPGWPRGAEAIFNSLARVAWWEGPPFGGGQWHAECRGDARVLNVILAEFARVDVKTRRIVVRDGVGRSVWINPNREPDKKADARLDWVFMVWQPESWKQLRTLPVDLNPTGARDGDDAPPSQIDVYTGGSVTWSDVKVPAGIEVVDQRLEAHGFNLADGVVVEGKLVDLATRRPIAGRALLQRVEPQPKGGYRYPTLAEAASDARGRWVIRKAPGGWSRIVVEADGFVPRVAGYARSDDGGPSWASYEVGLSRPGAVSGRVTDDNGRPLADVGVRLANVAAEGDDRYELPDGPEVTSGADGRFRVDRLPIGRATVWLHKPGYCSPGLGKPVRTPAGDVELSMTRAGRVRVTVDFAGVDRPDGYIVHIVPEGGEAVGKWSGSANLGPKNEVSFDDVPPSRYVLHGQPNPGSEREQTRHVTVDLKGGETAEITLKAGKK